MNAPEPKDYERALGLAFEGDENTPQSGKASRMAKSITDRSKMVRRAKAIVGIWGVEDYFNERGGVENVWIPFRSALESMGFSQEEIYEISQFEIAIDSL